MVSKTRRKPYYKAAFDMYVDLVRDISGVQSVVMTSGSELEMTTFIEVWDYDVLSQLSRAEGRVLNEYLDIEVDSHVISLDGRPVSHWDTSDADLRYDRISNGD